MKIYMVSLLHRATINYLVLGHIMRSENTLIVEGQPRLKWQFGVVVTALVASTSYSMFSPISSKMGDHVKGIPSCYVTSHLGQLRLLPSVPAKGQW